MEDLIEGMVVPGIVTNITKFGAFVDIGIKQDGLVHISNMSKNIYYRSIYCCEAPPACNGESPGS